VLKKRHVVIVFLTVFLIVAFFIGATASQYPFDPWFDAYDDGKMNYEDLFYLADRYGTSGTAINKTELLCCLTKGNISVPAAAFNPFQSAWDTRNSGYHLFNYEGTMTWFFASVQLPDGATVTNFTTYWFDEGTASITCHLRRCMHPTSIFTMAEAYSPGVGAPQYGSSYDDTINYATVDNGQYMYMVYVDIPASSSHTDYFFNLAVIEWEYPTLP
jgi:hypothetical protein